MQEAERIKNLPRYLFAEIDRKKKELISKGVDIISLGIGDPDHPTPLFILKRIQKALYNPNNHRYPEYEGASFLRKAVAAFYKRRFGHNINPDTEVLITIGSKEAIFHLPYAFLNNEDYAIIPDPGYPVYGISTKMIGANIHKAPLLKENNFLIDIDNIPPKILKEAKIIFINYPNNPTGATADEGFFKKLVKIAKQYGILIAADYAYSDITFDGYKTPSMFDFDKNRDVSLEFHSLSKPFNMTGFRIGFVVSNEFVIDVLKRLKTNMDSGAFTAIQEGAEEALLKGDKATRRMVEIYQKRRDIVVDTLQKCNISFFYPKGTFYVWAEVPNGFSSISFVQDLMEKTGVIVTPGNGFGEYGEGFFRISTTINDKRLKEAMQRIKNFLS
ncbi:MAG: LL-diaminopimelate aminotransferase [Deltaproteobacteria bacterium]|nr:LL-diaminopimelate aminotransferase [Deltaproteobacteria bacterium]